MFNQANKLINKYRHYFKILLTIAIMVIIISNLRSDFIIKHFLNADAFYIILAFGTFIMSILVNTARLQLLLNFNNINVSYVQLLGINFIGLYFSIVLPGRTGGDVIRGYYLVKSSAKLEKVISSILVWRLIGILTMILIGSVALLASRPILKELTFIFNSIVTIFILIGLSFILLKCKFMEVFSGVLLSFAKRFKLYNRFDKHLKKIYTNILLYKNNKSLIYFNILISLFSNLFILTSWFILSCSISAEIPLSYFLVFLPLVSILQMIPVSFNGIGVREGATVILFSLIGVVRDTSFTIAMLFSMLSVLVSLTGGIIYLFYRHDIVPTKKETNSIRTI